MKILVRLLLVLLFGVAVIGCAPVGPEADAEADAGRFAEIRIESHPKGWGLAHKTVKADASIVGGHLSGGPKAPRVFESKSVLTPDDMSALKELVASAAGMKDRRQPETPDQNHAGYSSVLITYTDGTSLTAIAAWGEKFESKTIQSIWNTVSACEVGAW